jgi:hypothetical protein
LRLEEGVAGVKHLPCENSEPFSGNSSRIDSLLVVELDVELAVLNLLTLAAAEDVERVLKDVGATDVEVDSGTSSCLTVVETLRDKDGQRREEDTKMTGQGRTEKK